MRANISKQITTYHCTTFYVKSLKNQEQVSTSELSMLYVKTLILTCTSTFITGLRSKYWLISQNRPKMVVAVPPFNTLKNQRTSSYLGIKHIICQSIHLDVYVNFHNWDESKYWLISQNRPKMVAADPPSNTCCTFFPFGSIFCFSLLSLLSSDIYICIYILFVPLACRTHIQARDFD